MGWGAFALKGRGVLYRNARIGRNPAENRDPACRETPDDHRLNATLAD